MGSGTKLKASIVPETNCTTIVIKVKKPNNEKISWKLTFKFLK
jgi:hypothetical protein